MSKPFLVVFKREYLKLVKSKAFWATTLIMPIFIVIVSLVSGSSGQAMEDKLKEVASNAKSIYVLDETKIIPEGMFVGNLIKTDNYDFALGEVKTGNADAFIKYSSDIYTSKSIEVNSVDKGIMSLGSYDEFAKNLIKQGILGSFNDQVKVGLFNSTFTIQSKLFKDGQETSAGVEKLILPIVSLVIYFLFTTLSTSYLLMSVSEEKENRMIEIILSTVKPKDLIMGKILGQVSAVLTQIVALVGMVLIFINSQDLNLPIDLSKVEINPMQVILAVVYLLIGFIILATTMVGVGAAMPTYREASSFASIFIMLSIFPIYFFPLILVDPTGLISNIVTYFPFTAPMIVMLRSALGAITPVEILISLVTLIIFIYFLAQVSYKLFEVGSLEYNQKISFKAFFKTLKKKK